MTKGFVAICSNSWKKNACSEGRKKGGYAMKQDGHYGSSARIKLTNLHLVNHLSTKCKANWKMII